MAQINLGGLVSEGSNKVSGISSGLDSEKLIEAAVAAKQKSVTKLEDQIKINNNKASALSDLKSLLSDFKTTANSMRANYGYNGAQNNIFSQKKVSLSTATDISPYNYLEISADNKAQTSSFEIEVVQIAKSKIQQSRSFSSTTTPIVNASSSHIGGAFTAGIFQINGIDIELTESESLINVVSKINSQSSQTNVRATIIQPTSGDYRIKLESENTGLVNAYSITDASNSLNNVFTYDALEHPNLDVQAAADAAIKYNNITVTRSTNTINDFIDGITITAVKNMPVGEKILVTIDNNKEAAASSIATLVTKYNALMTFIETQQARGTDGKYLDTAVIQRNNFVNKAKQEIPMTLSSYVAGTSNYSTLKDLGIDFPSYKETQSSPEKKLLLEIDTNKFSNALESNFDDVRKVFEFDYSSTSSKFLVTKRSNNLSQNAFSIDVNTSRASDQIAKITYGTTTINATFTPTNASDLTKGGMIKGNAGTMFEGFEFYYSGTGSDIANFEATQGIADKLFNVLNGYLDKKYTASIGNLKMSASEVDLEVYSLQDQVIKYQGEIVTKTQRIDLYRDTLVKKYSALESALAKANSILQMLDIQQQALSNR